jgi:Do/DeqQ family serine protease
MRQFTIKLHPPILRQTLNSMAAAALMAGWLVAAPAHAALPAQLADNTPLPSLAPMLEKTTPAVVSISTYTTVKVENPLLQDPFFRHFFNVPDRPQRERRTQSAGSGVILDAQKGYVITNSHVIDKADEITVTLSDGRDLKAELVGKDPEVDIAVLKVPPNNLQAIPLADSTKLRVGDFVVAIGNPFGLGQTVTSGIVGALGRTGLGIEGYENFIQTDASINPGNSGGALVNLRGELVGINTAIIAPSGGNVGIGFAIPINMAIDIKNQLVEHGEVRRGRLGVIPQDLTPELAEAFGLSVTKGVVISQVDPDSAADTAGLRPGDVVTAVNGEPTHRAADLRNKIGLMRVGETLNLDVLRDGKPLKIKAKVGDIGGQEIANGNVPEALKGATFKDLERGKNYGLDGGVLVAQVEPGSAADRAGLNVGDIIVSVNRVAVNNLREFGGLIGRQRGRLLLQVIHENGGAEFILVR